MTYVTLRHRSSGARAPDPFRPGFERFRSRRMSGAMARRTADRPQRRAGRGLEAPARDEPVGSAQGILARSRHLRYRRGRSSARRLRQNDQAQSRRRHAAIDAGLRGLPRPSPTSRCLRSQRREPRSPIAHPSPRQPHYRPRRACAPPSLGLWAALLCGKPEGNPGAARHFPNIK